MSKELEELKRKLNEDESKEEDFGLYSKIYTHSNENLKEYISDLQSKRVLTVGASGDHLFSSVLAGASRVDIFDINKYTLMFIKLRIYALKYLQPVDILYFFTYLNVESYLKFNDYLPDDLKEFFDYVFLYSDRDLINDKFFNDPDEILNNTNYQNTKDLDTLKYLMQYVNGEVYNCSLYSLTNYIHGRYDVIYLSNILSYEKDYNKMFEFVRMLRDQYLNDDGEIFYDYVWTIKRDADKKAFFARQDKTSIDDETIENNKDIYDATEPIVINPAHDNHFNGSRTFNDVLLRIRK